MKCSDAAIHLWGRRIGAVSWDRGRETGVFQYDRDFAREGVEVAPMTMPLREAPYAFPGLDHYTFKRLPGLLADCLPDAFGNHIVHTWADLADSISAPVGRLRHVGARGIGAIEITPAVEQPCLDGAVNIARMVELINLGPAHRAMPDGSIESADIDRLLAACTAVGGARAKALVTFNRDTGEFRAGDRNGTGGFEPWILKFDGIYPKAARGQANEKGYGKIEYAYHTMAAEAGIDMAECRLHHEGGRSHFMTRRFDRAEDGQKLHMQSLAAMLHCSYSHPGATGYEQAMALIKQFRMGDEAAEQQFRRAVFNITARNQDDHVKNISFLMGQDGRWRLSPAYDVIHSYNPHAGWTRTHQMSLAGKCLGFEHDDLLRFGHTSGISVVRSRRMIDQVFAAVENWPAHAEKAGVDEREIAHIADTHRLNALTGPSRATLAAAAAPGS